MTTQIAPVVFYRIKSAASTAGNELFVRPGDVSSASSQLVQDHDASNGADARFHWGFVYDEQARTYRIFNAQSGMCVDAKGNNRNPGNGTVVQQYTWKSGQGNQEWYWVAAEQQMASSYNRKEVWDVHSGSTSPGAGLQLYQPTGGITQQWIMVPVLPR